MPHQKPTEPFPAWRLPKGMIKASDEELEKSTESCERWEWFGGALVIFGVAAAVGIAGVHPRYDSFLEQWGSAIADSFVAIGVAIEIKFGQMAGLRQDEVKRRSDEKVAAANERSAEANARAEEAALELDRFRAPRSLSRDQLYRVVEKVKIFAPLEFDASVNPGDPEFKRCLGFIERALQVAGWTQKSWDGPYFSENRSSVGLPNIGLGASVSNVAIFFLIEEVPPRYADAATALAGALMLEGITAEARGTFKRAGINPTKQYPIHIAVGPKT